MRDRVVLTDFNERDQEGHVLALAEDLAGGVKVGGIVLLRDSEGNEAKGRVVRITQDVAVLNVDWKSWEPAEARATAQGPRGSNFTLFIRLTEPSDSSDLEEALHERIRTTGASAGAKMR